MIFGKLTAIDSMMRSKGVLPKLRWLSIYYFWPTTMALFRKSKHLFYLHLVIAKILLSRKKNLLRGIKIPLGGNFYKA